jgi:hypothetical protein
MLDLALSTAGLSSGLCHALPWTLLWVLLPQLHCSYDDPGELLVLSSSERFLTLLCSAVPVYDGHTHNGWLAFMFTDANFKALTSWQLYKKGASEIPLNSVVSVGYMLGTYKGNSGSVLSSNIEFVIVISMPT